MEDAGSDRAQGAAERERNRPYRRFVAILFAVAVAGASYAMLRGIVRHLDRLPADQSQPRPATVDARALLACAEDLVRLEEKIRRSAGLAFGRAPGVADTSDPLFAREIEALEIEIRAIVARCHLDSGEGVAAELELVTHELETELRSYRLLFERHREDGLAAAQRARAAAQRAIQALKSRP